MGLTEIRHQVGELCRRLLVGSTQRAPEENQTRESDCRATVREEAGERQFQAPGEVNGQRIASCVLPQHPANVAGNQSVSARAVARGVLDANSTAAISNVLVFGIEGSTPLKRMEIHLRDPKEIPAILNLLAVALQRSGLDFRAVRDPRVPATEIWLTSPLHDEKETLLSCAAMVGVQMAQRAPANVASSRNQTQ